MPIFCITEFNTMDQSILDPASKLYQFKPEIVWLFINYRDVRLEIPFGCTFEEVEKASLLAVDRYVSFWNVLQRNSEAFIMQNNADIPLPRIFGNYEGAALWGRTNILRQFNLKLSQSVISGVTVFDLDYISSLYGKRFWFDNKFWYHQPNIRLHWMPLDW